MVDCTDKLKAQFPDMDPKRIQEIVDAHENIKGQSDYAVRSKEIRTNNALETKARAKNVISDAIAVKKFEKFVERDTWGGDFQEAYQAKFTGINKVKKEGNFNFMQVRESFRNRFLNMMKYAIPDNVKEGVTTGQFDIEIAEGIFLLNNGKNIDHLSPTTREISKNLKGVNKNLIDSLKDAGVDIRERSDYITRQSHNREKITDFTEWSSDIMREGVLDVNKTFGGISTVKDQQKILQKIFDRIQEDGLENTVGNFGGERTIHFATGKSWAEYNQKYGNGSIYDSIMATINSSSRAAASSSVMGTMNGRQLWDKSQKSFAKKLVKEGRRAELEKFQKGQRQRDAWGAEMFGYDRHPGRFNFESWTRTANLIQAGALLGKAVATTVTDLSFSSFNFRAATGAKGFVELEGIKTFFSSLSPEKFAYWSKALDMNFDDELADTFNRFGSFTGGGRSQGPAMELYRRAASVTGISKQSGRAKVTNARMFSTNLGRNINKNWGDLNPRLKAGLERFGINELDWKILKRATREYDNGLVAVIPEEITVDKGITRKRANKLRTKYATYLADQAKVGSPEVTGLERSFITQGISPDSAMGAFLRTAGQFKSFSLAIPRVLGRITQSDPTATSTKIAGFNIPTDKGDLKLLGGVMVQSTMLAAASIITKNLLKGEKTEIDAKLLGEAFTQGAVPLMFVYTMDAMRGEYDKHGRSFLKDLAGPTFGQLDDVTSLLSKTTDELIDVFEGRSDAKNPAAVAAMKLVMRNAPGQNLPMVKPLLNKAFLTQFYEHFNPGYEERLKSSAARRGVEHLFNPL